MRTAILLGCLIIAVAINPTMFNTLDKDVGIFISIIFWAMVFMDIVDFTNNYNKKKL